MQPRQWLLSCGHTAPMLERDSAELLPSRPRMCERCGRLRQVEAPAAASVDELECEACGARGRDGFRADDGMGDEEIPERELVMFCSECLERELGD